MRRILAPPLPPNHRNPSETPRKIRRYSQNGPARRLPIYPYPSDPSRSEAEEPACSHAPHGLSTPQFSATSSPNPASKVHVPPRQAPPERPLVADSNLHYP